ncbi:polyhydroxyalkanoate depolymerase, partial [bacterium]|nr:polyhydroxyalkanoate depolymerase [bacterium]
MLYQLVEMHHWAMQPVRFMAGAAADALTLPLQAWRPWLPPAARSMSQSLARAVAAGAEMMERSTRRFGKSAFAIPGLTERVAEEKPFYRLLHFVSDTSAGKPKVLVIAPMSGHHATLLRDTVAGLAVDHNVYITDWVDARMAPKSLGRFGLDDYIEYVIG